MCCGHQSGCFTEERESVGAPADFSGDQERERLQYVQCHLLLPDPLANRYHHLKIRTGKSFILGLAMI